MELDEYRKFIDRILGKLDTLHIDVSEMEMDHIAYQASTDDDYDTRLTEFNQLGNRVSEEIVGGRRVSIYKLFQPIVYRSYTVTAIELIAPKAGETCPSALEHVEFILKETFASFMARYPGLPWDMSAMNRPDFPMLKLKLDDHLQVKFHLSHILDIIESQKSGSQK